MSGYSGAGGNNDSSHYLLNMYSSRSKLLDPNTSAAHQRGKSPNKELEKALDHMFKGFSFYSEPIEESEVQRQIKEYLRMKNQLKKMN